METFMLAGMILNPIGIIVLLTIPVLPIFMARSEAFPARRLVLGYVGAIVALALVAAAAVYVSPEEAASKWNVSAEHYWNALFLEFAATLSVGTLFAVVGISFIGLPLLVFLTRSARASIPWWLAASLVISVLAAAIFYLLIRGSSNATFLGLVIPAAVSHGALALGFALAIRLPWRAEAAPGKGDPSPVA